MGKRPGGLVWENLEQWEGLQNWKPAPSPGVPPYPTLYSSLSPGHMALESGGIVEWRGSLFVAQVGLKLSNLLPLPPKYDVKGLPHHACLSHVNGFPKHIELHLDLGERDGLSKVQDGG